MKHFKSFVAFCLACSFLIPQRVYADNPTYSLFSGCAIFGQDNSWRTLQMSVSREVRAVIFDQGYAGYVIGFASTSSFSYSSTTNGTCPAEVQPFSADSTNYNGQTVYYVRSPKTIAVNFNANGIPVISGEGSLNDILYYTFGDGAIDPIPPTPIPPAYGDLVDVRFNTSIAGSGDASINNIDHITWNPDHDSNEIMFDGSESVQIRVIAGNYTSSTRNGLLAGTVTDFDYNSSAEHMLAEYPVTRGYYDVTWSHVIEQLHAGSISEFLQIRKSNDVWLKSGWIYQIRLIAGDYEGNWITIYNGTSSGVQNSLTIENSTEINTTLINTIQQINNLNNSIDEDWTINNITINMENSDGNNTTDKPWWAYLLEAIVSLCSGILSFLGGLIGDLIDAILGLFQPAEFTINNYNDFKIELKQNSGIFGQSFDFISTLKNTFLGVEYQEPIIHWSGISFGETELIPAADYNLNEYVTMWGLSDFRQMAYLCSDGFIYLSLLVLIMRKLNEVLKK